MYPNRTRYLAVSRPSETRHCRPHHSQPGTLRQQLEAIEHYLGDPSHIVGRSGAWQTVRWLAISHASWGSER